MSEAISETFEGKSECPRCGTLHRRGERHGCMEKQIERAADDLLTDRPENLVRIAVEEFYGPKCGFQHRTIPCPTCKAHEELERLERAATIRVEVPKLTEDGFEPHFLGTRWRTEDELHPAGTIDEALDHWDEFRERVENRLAANAGKGSGKRPLVELAREIREELWDVCGGAVQLDARLKKIEEKAREIEREDL